MTEAAILDQSIFSALLESNPYFSKNNNLELLQKKQLEDFLQKGFPTRKNELWKYTDTTFLAKQHFAWPTKSSGDLENTLAGIRFVFVNGYFSPELSDLSLLPNDIVLCPLSKKIAENSIAFLEELDANHYPFSALNTALMTDGFYLSIPDHVVLKETIHCLFIHSKQDHFLICPRNVIVAGAHSQVTLIEEYRSEGADNYFTNVVTQIDAADNAKIHYHKIQSESNTATHVSHLFVNQKQNSVIKSFYLDTGARLAREDITVNLSEHGAECSLNGFYKLETDKQHIDNHIFVDHRSEHTHSNMFYKGTLDKKSSAVFNGKVFVHKEAQKVTALQSNHNLLLSSNAEINTKPELEIYADDVKCSHGATVGQLEADALFYLQARGISKEQAVLLLVSAFSDDVMRMIENAHVKQYIQQRADHDAK